MVGICEVIVGLIMLVLVICSLFILNDYNLIYYNQPISKGGKRAWYNRKRGFKVRSFGSNNESVISKEEVKFENNV